MKDIWATSYRAAMADARRRADTTLSNARRQLDIDLANPKAQTGDLLTSWVNWRTTAAMHRTIVEMQADSAPFLDTLQHSASGTTGRPN